MLLTSWEALDGSFDLNLPGRFPDKLSACLVLLFFSAGPPLSSSLLKKIKYEMRMSRTVHNLGLVLLSLSIVDSLKSSVKPFNGWIAPVTTVFCLTVF